MSIVISGGGREVLTADRTYYVRTDGSDSNNGLANSSGGAFLTLQKAVDVTCGLDLSIYNVTIQAGAGTYTGNIVFSGPWGGKGSVTIKGDSSTPSNCVISTSSFCLGNTGVLPAGLTIDGFKLTSSANSCIVNNGLGVINFQNIEFGSASLRHISVSGGKVTATGNYSVSGGAQIHVYVENSGYAQLNTRTVTFSASVTFSTAFASITRTSGLLANSMTFTLGAFSVTGTRYTASVNAWIVTSGGGASYFPGDAAGSTATGGQYS
jgi:hypothetical protein